MRPPIVIFSGCGGWIWTTDLLVMSQASYRTANTPRGCGGWTRTSDLQLMRLTSYHLLYPAWWPQGESNSCLRRERATSWTAWLWGQISRPVAAGLVILSQCFGIIVGKQFWPLNWLLTSSLYRQAGTPARLGIEPNYKFCHRTTQHSYSWVGAYSLVLSFNHL